ncbi:MAG: hypothetical protein COB36_12495 [Alphaproteobacteria bacterium]|nr:MAG: hypothetical protein COB36_12495 [Alphaproteobacteria bacterium]
MTPELKSLLKSAFALKCGRCGKGALFKSYLKFDTHCPVCDLNYDITDTADGPAFFVGFMAMVLFSPIFILISFFTPGKLALGIGYVVASLACLGFCLGLLPFFKAVLFNLQIHHQAGECDFDYVGTHGRAPKNWEKFLKQQADNQKK